MKRLLGFLAAVAFLCSCPLARALESGTLWRPLSVISKCLDANERLVLKRWEEGKLEVAQGELAFVSIKRGSWVRARAPGIRIGLAYGKEISQAAVVWSVQRKSSGQLRVPVQAGARWMVFGRKGTGAIEAEVAVAADDPMKWFRFEEDFQEWIAGKGAIPEAVEPAARYMLRLASEVRRALPSAEKERVARWLGRRLQEQALEATRPRPPFYRRVPVRWRGAPEALSEAKTMVLNQGASVRFEADGSSLISAGLRAWGGTRTTVQLRVGDALIRVFDWGGWERAGQDGWTGYWRLHQWLTPPRGTPITLLVVRGRARVRLEAFKRVPSFLEYLSERFSAFRGYPAPDNSAMGLVAELQAYGSHAARERARRYIDDGQKPASARAFVAAELALMSSSVPEALDAARFALNPEFELGERLRLRVVERLLLLKAKPSVPVCREIGVGNVAKSAAIEARRNSDRYGLFRRSVLELLCNAGPGQRPTALAALTQISRSLYQDRRLNRLAQKAASLGTGWRLCKATDEARSVIEWTRPNDGRDDGVCTTQGASRQRWRVVRPGSTSFEVETAGKPFTRAAIRTASYQDDWEGYLQADGVPVAVHGATGLPSTIWLRAGKHSFELPRNAPPLLLSASMKGPVPCRELREIHRWTALRDNASFVLPDPGVATTVRVKLRGVDGGSLPAKLAAVVGDRLYQVRLMRRATEVAFELPVAAAAHQLRLEKVKPAVLARVEIRLAKAGAGAAPQIRSDGSKKVGDRDEAEDVEEALRRIRATSRALAGIDDIKERGVLLVQRAIALEFLGYRQLAALDRAEAGLPPLERKAGPATPADSIPATVLGNTLSRIPPCPPSDPSLLFGARRALRHGRRPQALQLLEGKGRGADAETLLQAVLAEAAGHAARAAASWERLNNPFAFARAARIYADESARTQDKGAALRAFVVATRAKNSGAPAEGTLARVAGSVLWIRPVSTDSAAGSRSVQRPAGSTRSNSLAFRLRRAWVDAPQDAVLLLEGENLNVSAEVHAPIRLLVQGRCAPFLSGSRCRLMRSLDGAPLEEISEQGSDLFLKAGRHELVISTEGLAVAWIRIESDRGSPKLLASVSELWYLATEKRDIEMNVIGPTVARLSVRAASDVSTTALVMLDGVIQGRTAIEAGRIWKPDIAIDEQGVHTISIRSISPETPLLARIALATTDLPAKLSSRQQAELPDIGGESSGTRPASGKTGTPGIGGLTPRDYQLPHFAHTQPKEITEPGPFTSIGHLRYVGADVRDEVDIVAEGAPYGELGVTVLRAFGDHPFYLQATPFVRIRSSPLSYGVNARFETPAADLIPRLIVGGGVIQQRFEPPAVSWQVRMMSIWRLRIGQALALYPSLIGRAHWVGSVPLEDTGADPDVYTEYREEHPYALGLSVTAYGRALVDLSYQVRTRIWLSPEPYTLDRAEAMVGADLLPGRGWCPWLNLSYQIGYLPSNHTRGNDLVRHKISGFTVFWRWITGTLQLNLGMRASWHVALGAFAWALELNNMWSPGRGVGDLPPYAVEHRARLNEGAVVSGYWTPSNQGGVGGF